MFAIGRRTMLLGAGAVSLLGVAGLAAASAELTSDDVALGRADAPVTLIEYASVMCPHCREWHEAVWAPLKANYIDTGRVRYVLREMAAPASAASLVLAGFQIARCNGATPEQYMSRVGEIFLEQPDIYASTTMAEVRAKFESIAHDSGLSQSQMLQCVNDPAGPQRMQRIADAAARDFQVTGTPTFVINGRLLDDPNVHTYEGLSHILDAELAGHS